MPAKIIDEFTNLPISGLAKWRLRKRRDKCCIWCGEKLSDLSSVKCEDCRRDGVNNYRVLQAKKLRQGLCYCGNPVETGFKYCPNCNEKAKEIRAMLTFFDPSQFATTDGRRRLKNPIAKREKDYW